MFADGDVNNTGQAVRKHKRAKRIHTQPPPPSHSHTTPTHNGQSYFAPQPTTKDLFILSNNS